MNPQSPEVPGQLDALDLLAPEYPPKGWTPPAAREQCSATDHDRRDCDHDG